MSNQPMKTLTIDGVTYEIVDDSGRNRITNIEALVSTPLVANTVSAMIDTSKVYVYTGSETGYTSGNWYYWNGTAWTSGGIYNYILDGSIAETKLDSELTTKISNKANLSDVSAEATTRANADTALSNQIAALQASVGSPLVASTVSAMTDTTKIYVYTGSETGYTSGNWYYYNGSAWVSGGVYNAVAVQTDTTLSFSGMPADAKKTVDEIGAIKADLLDISEHTNLFGNTSDEIKSWLINGSGVVNSDVSARTIIIPCEPNTVYRISKNAGGRFRVGNTATTPTTGITLSNLVADNTASSILYTTDDRANYIVAFVFYAVTDGNDATTMLNSVKVIAISAIDRIARKITESVENGYSLLEYNNDLSLLTNSGSGRYILGAPFPKGNVESVFVYVTANSEIEVRLYTLESGTLNVAHYAKNTTTTAGLLEIPIKKTAIEPFYIMINRVSGGLYFKSNSAYDVYAVSAADTYTLSSLSVNHYEFGINVKYNVVEKYSPLGKNYLLIGDSYLEGYTADGNVTSWGEKLKQYMGIEYNTVIKYKGGIGFVEGTGTLAGYSFKSLALSATVPNPNTITHIVVCGGYNDAVRSGSVGETGVLNAISDFVDNVLPVYPNANLYIGMIGYRNNDDAVLGRIRGAGLSAYQTANRYGANEKVRYLNNVEWTLFSDDMSSDGYHPNAVGQMKIAMNVKNALLTGSAPIKTFARDNG